MVVCPGGGYAGLARHEGHDYALWLNQHGVAAFVLKYRTTPAGGKDPQDPLHQLGRLAGPGCADHRVDPRALECGGKAVPPAQVEKVCGVLELRSDSLDSAGRFQGLPEQRRQLELKGR